MIPTFSLRFLWKERSDKTITGISPEVAVTQKYQNSDLTSGKRLGTGLQFMLCCHFAFDCYCVDSNIEFSSKNMISNYYLVLRLKNILTKLSTEMSKSKTQKFVSFDRNRCELGLFFIAFDYLNNIVSICIRDLE